MKTLLAGLALGMFATVATAGLTNFVNFETAPVHPVALGPDGRTLAVCNLPDARVELFDVSTGVPVALDSMAVGIDPVSVRFASTNELWVVNHISSTISVVDVAARTVVATLETTAGPSDVVFAGNPRRAWVTCSRTNAVMVFDLETRAVVGHLPIQGERPRAMAASPDGAKVYAAIFESGNGTTVLGRKLTGLNTPPAPGPVEATNGPYGGLNPPPNSGTNFSPAINPAITSNPPRVSHVVRRNPEGRWMDDNNGDWTEFVSGTNSAISGRVPGWDVPDRDVAIIDTTTMDVSYAQRLMNLCMGIAVNPASGEITVIGTDGTNERRFEPNLRGVFLRVNLGLVDPVTRTNRIRDLNPHLDYIARTVPPVQRALSLGDPRGIEWNSDGTRAYITGMGSGNLIVVNADGMRVNPQPIELGEGPTGMALDEGRGRLYVWNRFSSTIAVVDTIAGVVVTNVPVFDPTPDIVRRGRRHLYDTRANSGLGHASCASCHPDARMDRLAWDLGDPAGNLVTNRLSNVNAVFHPMKGPMVTMTMQDIIAPTNLTGAATQQLAFHWRGDRKRIEDFNPTFTALLARDTQLTSNQMADFKGMLGSIFFPPNPLRTFSNSLPESVALPGHYGRVTNGVASPLPPGNPLVGLGQFQSSCRRCHDFNAGRAGATNISINLARNGSEGAFLFSQLRSLADRTGMDGMSTNSRAGFGLMHDGRVDTLTRFMVDGFFTQTDEGIANMVALLLCFSGSDVTLNPSTPSQDTPAAVGRQVTLASPSPPPRLEEMFSLALRPSSRVQLVVRGKKDGLPRQWLMRRATQDFQADCNGEVAPSLASIISSAAPGNEFTAILVPEGSGLRLALDRDDDGYFDATEIKMGYNPSDPLSHPGRILSISKNGGKVALTWESAVGLKYAVDWTTNFPKAVTNTWRTLVPSFLAITNVTGYTDAPPLLDRQRFYRIRREP